MKIEDIKAEMLDYLDFFGGDLLGSSKIEKCRAKRELVEILDRHESFLEDQLSDAKTHLSNLRQRLEL